MPTQWCLHLYDYRAEVEVDGRPIELHPGMITLIPPGTSMVYRFRSRVSEHHYAHFTASGPAVDVASVHPLGPAGRERRRLFANIIAHRGTQPRRAEATLWSLLWSLTDRAVARPSSGQSAGLPQALSEAVAYIDANLHRDFRVADLVAHVGQSHNHLTRQFRAQFDQTIAGFIRRQRIERAQHLLRETDRPVSAVACDVGLPDLQQFNKTFRREVGIAPTHWRSRVTSTIPTSHATR